MLRHGETEDNLKKIYSRHTTILTDKGKNQIIKARKLLNELKYEKIYYSPLKRTMETLEYLGLEGIEEPRIREIDFGIFTGKTYEQISKIYPEETKSWTKDSIGYKIPQGESLFNVYYRVEEFLEEICKLNKNVLLITHDSVIRSALCWIFNEIEYFFRFKIDNGSISIISIEDKFKYIKKLNLTSI